MLKWGKNVYDIDIVRENGLEFKKRVEKLTRKSVFKYWELDLPVAKQNIICNALWKGFLQDSYVFDPVKCPDFCSVIVFGSINEAIANVTGMDKRYCWKVGHQFVESLNASTAIESGILPPAGLMNLGNTCYANSVIQVLHKIPELEEGVESVADVDSGRGTPGALASELKKTFDQMDHSLSAVKPISLVNVLLLECDKE